MVCYSVLLLLADSFKLACRQEHLNKWLKFREISSRIFSSIIWFGNNYTYDKENYEQEMKNTGDANCWKV